MGHPWVMDETSVVDIAAIRPLLAGLCRKYGIAELLVFGSTARGEASPDSDVDLVAKDSLHWIIRDRVLADAQVVYAAA